MQLSGFHSGFMQQTAHVHVTWTWIQTWLCMWAQRINFQTRLVRSMISFTRSLHDERGPCRYLWLIVQVSRLFPVLQLALQLAAVRSTSKYFKVSLAGVIHTMHDFLMPHIFNIRRQISHVFLNEASIACQDVKLCKFKSHPVLCLMILWPNTQAEQDSYPPLQTHRPRKEHQNSGCMSGWRTCSVTGIWTGSEQTPVEETYMTGTLLPCWNSAGDVMILCHWKQLSSYFNHYCSIQEMYMVTHLWYNTMKPLCNSKGVWIWKLYRVFWSLWALPCPEGDQTGNCFLQEWDWWWMLIAHIPAHSLLMHSDDVVVET